MGAFWKKGAKSNHYVKHRKMLRNIGICGVTVLLCREEKKRKGEKKGVKAISDWLEGELKLFIKKFRGGTAV